MVGIEDEEEEEEEEAAASNAPTSKLKADFGIEEDKPSIAKLCLNIIVKIKIRNSLLQS